MGEEGLKAYHEITKNINDQDERVWRQTAAKKCWKKEIQNIEEQTIQFEVQIATLKKDPLYKKYEEFGKILKDNMKEHLLTHKLLSLAISAKNEETNRKENDIKSWDKKYLEAIIELKEAYEIKRTFLESTNSTYKKLTEINDAQKIAAVRLKQIQASSKRRQEGKKQLNIIREKIFHKLISNFAKAVLRKKEYERLRAKLKDLEEKKKKTVQEMFEAQETLRKLPVRHSQIPSGMFTKRVPNLPQPRLIYRNEVKTPDSTYENNTLKRPAFDQNILALSEKIEAKKRYSEEKENEETLTPPTPKKSSKSPNRLNIIANKVISLPPLKTILSKKRSKLDSSFNRSFCLDSSFRASQNSQNSQKDPPKKKETTPKCSQEDKPQLTEKISISQEKQKEPEPQQRNIVETPKPSDLLKNLKFTSQSNKFQMPKTKTPVCKQDSQMNINKISILKGQTNKRVLNESFQDEELVSSQRKKEKIVNFASPLHEQIDIDQTASSNEVNMVLSPLNTSRMNMSNFLDDNMTNLMATNTDGFNLSSSKFNFAATTEDDKQPGEDDGMSIFGGATDAAPSFGFSFGGSSKTNSEMWDLFG